MTKSLFFGDAYMIFGIVLSAALMVIVPTLLATSMAWTCRKQGRIVGILAGIGVIIGFMIFLWLYGILEVERCTQTCSSGAPQEACRFSCNLESSWPFIHVGEFLLLFDMLVFAIVGNYLARRSKHHLPLPNSA